MNFTYEQLKKLSTKRLYTILKGLRGCVLSCNYDESWYGEEPENPSKEELMYNMVKDELNTREHIPRKRVIRNQAKPLEQLHVKELKELLSSRQKRRKYFTWMSGDPEKTILNILQHRWFPDKEKFFEDCNKKYEYGKFH